jgi:hypothetical protein
MPFASAALLLLAAGLGGGTTVRAAEQAREIPAPIVDEAKDPAVVSETAVLAAAASGACRASIST